MLRFNSVMAQDRPTPASGHAGRLRKTWKTTALRTNLERDYRSIFKQSIPGTQAKQALSRSPAAPGRLLCPQDIIRTVKVVTAAGLKSE
jgi:hypothetical protein